VKEPNFFALADGRMNLRGPFDETSMFRLTHRKSVTSFDAYKKLFANAKAQMAIGEASPRYLYAPQAPVAIQQYLGSPKLIAILRNPVDRAYSHFLMNRRRGVEPMQSFADALDAEEERVASGWDWDWHYVRLGMYSAQIARFLKCFNREDIRLFLYDELKRDPLALLKDVFGFLDVDTEFSPQVTRRYKVSLTVSSDFLTNLAFGPENTRLGRLAYRLIPQRLGQAAQNSLQEIVGRLSTKKVPPLGPTVRRRLTDIFREDTLRLECLIERDLSAWRSA
jgi:hypothetical protein